MKYILDTNICIYLIKQNPASVIRRFKSHALGATLAPNNTREFKQIKNLKIADWSV